jgi:hypothetical protein
VRGSLNHNTPPQTRNVVAGDSIPTQTDDDHGVDMCTLTEWLW